MNTPYLMLILLVASLLSACATPPETLMSREMAGVQGKPPTFTAGYHDGCQSGLNAAGDNRFQYAKNLAKANQAEYKLGWEDGFRVCQSREVQRNQPRDAHYGVGYGFGSPGGFISFGTRL